MHMTKERVQCGRPRRKAKSTRKGGGPWKHATEEVHDAILTVQGSWRWKEGKHAKTSSLKGRSDDRETLMSTYDVNHGTPGVTSVCAVSYSIE